VEEPFKEQVYVKTTTEKCFHLLQNLLNCK